MSTPRHRSAPSFFIGTSWRPLSAPRNPQGDPAAQVHRTCQSSAPSTGRRKCPPPASGPSGAFLEHRRPPCPGRSGILCITFPSSICVFISLLLGISCQHVNVTLSLKKCSLSSWTDPPLESSCLSSFRALQPPSWPDAPREQSTFRISSSSLSFHPLSR